MTFSSQLEPCIMSDSLTLDLLTWFFLLDNLLCEGIYTILNLILGEGLIAMTPRFKHILMNDLPPPQLLIQLCHLLCPLNRISLVLSQPEKLSLYGRCLVGYDVRGLGVHSSSFVLSCLFLFELMLLLMPV